MREFTAEEQLHYAVKKIERVEAALVTFIISTAAIATHYWPIALIAGTVALLFTLTAIAANAIDRTSGPVDGDGLLLLACIVLFTGTVFAGYLAPGPTPNTDVMFGVFVFSILHVAATHFGHKLGIFTRDALHDLRVFWNSVRIITGTTDDETRQQ